MTSSLYARQLTVANCHVRLIRQDLARGLLHFLLEVQDYIDLIKKMGLDWFPYNRF